MTGDYIKKLPSGFYAMYSKDGKMIQSSMIKWNGTRYLDSFGNWQEFPETVVKCRDFETWYQDPTGTVYLQYNDGTFCYMYSPGSVLYKHLCEMQRFRRRCKQ